MNALMEAILNDDRARVEALLRADTTLATRLIDREARDGQRRIIQEFLSAGVSKLLKDGKGKTVLDCARSGWIRDLLTAT